MAVQNLSSLLASWLLSAMLLATLSFSASALDPIVTQEPMQGVPPARESQVTMQNYREYPMNKWAFRNAGAPLNIVMIPRAGTIFPLPGPSKPALGQRLFTTAQGQQQSFDDLFESNYADGVVVMKGNRLVYEKYFHGFHADAQHIWFSMSKSFASSAFGLLVAKGKVDLNASPADYIPELKGSGFERVTIQHVLDHATAIDFKETYTDFTSDFALKYAPAMNMGYLPGARELSRATPKYWASTIFWPTISSLI